MAGEPIGRLHQLLLELGYSLESQELSRQVFGVTTRAAVEDFQNRHVAQDGSRLIADGIVGPRTLWALQNPRGPGNAYVAPGWRAEPSTVRPAVRAVVQDAIGDIGKREIGSSNDGPDLAKFRTGGLPWCAYAVSTWYEKADQGSPFGRLASAWKIRTWAKGHNAIVEPETAQPGDIWLAIRAGGHGHVELIVANLEHDQVACVGGNVGNAVRGTIRAPSAATMIVRPIPVV